MATATSATASAKSADKHPFSKARGNAGFFLAADRRSPPCKGSEGNRNSPWEIFYGKYDFSLVAFVKCAIISTKGKGDTKI